MLLTVYYAHPKIRTEIIAPRENSICFPISSQMPQGCTWESWSCMPPLFIADFFLLHNPGRGRRAEVTHTQRLICLLVKRNFSPQFRVGSINKFRVWQDTKRRKTQWETDSVWCRLNKSRTNWSIKTLDKRICIRLHRKHIHTYTHEKKNVLLHKPKEICATCLNESPNLPHKKREANWHKCAHQLTSTLNLSGWPVAKELN